MSGAMGAAGGQESKEKNNEGRVHFKDVDGKRVAYIKPIEDFPKCYVPLTNTFSKLASSYFSKDSDDDIKKQVMVEARRLADFVVKKPYNLGTGDFGTVMNAFMADQSDANALAVLRERRGSPQANKAKAEAKAKADAEKRAEEIRGNPDLALVYQQQDLVKEQEKRMKRNSKKGITTVGFQMPIMVTSRGTIPNSVMVPPPPQVIQVQSKDATQSTTLQVATMVRERVEGFIDRMAEGTLKDMATLSYVTASAVDGARPVLVCMKNGDMEGYAIQYVGPNDAVKEVPMTARMLTGSKPTLNIEDIRMRQPLSLQDRVPDLFSLDDDAPLRVPAVKPLSTGKSSSAPAVPPLSDSAIELDGEHEEILAEESGSSTSKTTARAGPKPKKDEAAAAKVSRKPDDVDQAASGRSKRGRPVTVTDGAPTKGT